MQNNLNDLVKYLTPLLDKLSASEMAKLNKKVGADLRKSQQQRISSQANPDGSAYTPRRLRQGQRIRRKMFSKLRTTKYLLNFSNADKVSVGFLSQVNRIASVHQFGFKDRVERDGPSVTYPKRELLGFSDADVKLIEDSVLKHLDVIGK